MMMRWLCHEEFLHFKDVCCIGMLPGASEVTIMPDRHHQAG